MRKMELIDEAFEKPFDRTLDRTFDRSGQGLVQICPKMGKVFG